MVLRFNGWRVITPAAALLAVAGVTAGALAQSQMTPPSPPAGIPTAGSVAGGTLVWGGAMPSAGGYVPSQPRAGETPGPAPEPAPFPSAEPGRSLYDDLVGRSAPAQAAAVSGPSPSLQSPAAFAVPGAEPPPLPAPVAVEDGAGIPDSSLPLYGAPADDPWAGLKAPTPGAAMSVPALAPEPARRAAPEPERRRAPAREAEPRKGVIASLGERLGLSGSDSPGRGRLEGETPTGYAPLPRSEAMCRRALQQLGVKFVDVGTISKGRGCGIPHPVKITQIAPGVAMLPAATLNCAAAARLSQWVEDEVKSAARWKLWKRPTAVLNASSYRCSRIAGSRSVSEHASGNALDVRGFKFSDGSVFDVEKKGFFSFREKGFQKAVRQSGCEYFGTVLGPGYNYDHRDHLHLDLKKRRRVVCK